MNKILSRHSFTLVFVSVNIIFVFLLIYRKSYLVNLNYQKQRLEYQLQVFKKERDIAEHNFFILKNPNRVQKYAVSKLGMQKVKIDQLKKLNL
jgi:cell division protein FtsL